MGDWATLERELTHWLEGGHTASLWWRDDDASHPTPALERLLDLSSSTGVPVALAVIPSHGVSALAHRLDAYPQVRVLQHGYAHRNHAPRGEKRAEFGGHRPLPQMTADLRHGRERLMQLFKNRELPVLVPPWNRIHRTLLRELPGIGFKGLSTFKARRTARPWRGLRQTNCHVDLVDWRRSRRFVGKRTALEGIIAHLCARREGRVDAGEPTGLLTHHLDHDSDCWAFLAEFLRLTQAHPAVQWVDANEALLLA